MQPSSQQSGVSLSSMTSCAKTSISAETPPSSYEGFATYDSISMIMRLKYTPLLMLESRRHVDTAGGIVLMARLRYAHFNSAIVLFI